VYGDFWCIGGEDMFCRPTVDLSVPGQVLNNGNYVDARSCWECGTDHTWERNLPGFKRDDRSTWCEPKEEGMFCTLSGSLPRAGAGRFLTFHCRGCDQPLKTARGVQTGNNYKTETKMLVADLGNEWCDDGGKTVEQRDELIAKDRFMSELERVLLLEGAEKSFEGDRRTASRARDLKDAKAVALVGMRAQGLHMKDQRWDILVIFDDAEWTSATGGTTRPVHRSPERLRLDEYDIMFEDARREDWLSRDITIHATGYAVWLKGECPWKAEDIDWKTAAERKLARVQEEAKNFENSWLSRPPGDEQARQHLRKLINELRRLTLLQNKQPIPAPPFLRGYPDTGPIAQHWGVRQAIHAYMDSFIKTLPAHVQEQERAQP
jgi:hypothetical protein